MSARLSVVVVIFCFSVCANAQTYTLGIHRDSNQAIDSAVTHEAQQELQRLLAPAGIRVTWQNADERKTDATYEKLVVAFYDGNCSVAELPAVGFAPHTNKLADTVIGSEGQLRPFFRVDCSRLIWTLRPLLDRLNVPARNLVFGRAMARVMAHEIYHILADAAGHAESGIAKPSFSIKDLITNRFDFSTASLDRMRDQTNQPRIAVNQAN